MKLLLVDGSARENTPVGAVLDELSAALSARGIETERFWPISDPRALCSGCGACRGAGVCVNDLRPADFVKAAVDCDGFVFAVPANLLGTRLRTDTKHFLTAAFSRAARRKENPLTGKCTAMLIAARGSGGAVQAQLRAELEAAGLRPVGEALKLPAAQEQIERLAQALCDALS